MLRCSLRVMATCGVEGCVNPVHGRMRTGEQFCSKHYQRIYRAANRDRVNRRRARWRQRPDVIERERAQRQEYRLRRQHGLTVAALAEILAAQDGRCYLCGQELLISEIYIEHDHKCCPPLHSCVKCRRGLSCMACNLIVGHVQEDPDRLRRIADALEKANSWRSQFAEAI